MKVTFFSNFMNHHQLPFCKEMVKLLGNDFKFVATEDIPVERKELGYESMNDKFDFIIKAYENDLKAFQLAIDSDVVIIGSAPDKYIKERIKQKKLVFRYSERIHKSGFKLKPFLYVFFKRTFLEKNNIFLLCSSAYAANDYNASLAYINRTYKWGYFPETVFYKDIENIIKTKIDNSLLWVARFIEWKHPEIVVEIAKKLKSEGYSFKINMIGVGEYFDKIKSLIKYNNLEQDVFLLGSMSPNDVRSYMEKSSIFLFTSDRGEGWGAVLNEAMNSACAVVASHEIGAVPFMINDNKNGIIYEDGNFDELYNKVKFLLDNKKTREKLGMEAYTTIVNLWNSKIAAERIINLSNHLLNGDSFNEYNDGPCSFAKRIKDNWYKKVK